MSDSLNWTNKIGHKKNIFFFQSEITGGKVGIATGSNDFFPNSTVKTLAPNTCKGSHTFLLYLGQNEFGSCSVLGFWPQHFFFFFHLRYLKEREWKNVCLFSCNHNITRLSRSSLNAKYATQCYFVFLEIERRKENISDSQKYRRSTRRTLLQFLDPQFRRTTFRPCI